MQSRFDLIRSQIVLDMRMVVNCKCWHRVRSPQLVVLSVKSFMWLAGYMLDFELAGGEIQV